MIRLAGIGTSGDRGHQQPPPASSSSSSTLSPLAPPFTVDRWVSFVANPSPLPPIPPTGAMSPFFVPTGDSVWSSASSGASRLSNLNSGKGAMEATRYYPYYEPARDSVDGSLEKMSKYKGYVGGWSEASDLEEGRPARGSVVNSSWMDSPANCQMSSALKKRGTVDSFSAYEDSFGSWHGAHNESSLTRGLVGSECTECLDDSHKKIYVNMSKPPNVGAFQAELDSTVWSNEGSSYFYSPETTSVVKECDTFIPSSYDRYISQLVSCSRDLEVHYPAQTYSSRQEYAPSNERNESVLSCVLKHGNSVIKHANLHRSNDNYVDYLIGVQNETGIYDNVEGTEVGLEKMRISSDAIQRNREASDSSLQIKGLSSGNSTALAQSIDCLQDEKFGLKVANLSCCNSSKFERAALIPDDSIQTSQEIPDHLNVGVDSPCWKGASVSRQHPFSFNQIVQPPVISVSCGGDDLVQVQRSLEIQSEIKQDGTVGCNKNGKDIDLSPVTDLSGADIKFQDSAEGASNPIQVEHTKEIERHDILGEHISALNDRVGAPQGIDDHVRQSSQVENIICKAGSNTSKATPEVQNSDIVLNHISTSPNRSSTSNTNANNGEMNSSSLNVILPAALKKPVSSDAPSKCLSQEQDTRVLIKAMLGLSEVLSCHYCNDSKVLEECDLKPVQQIIGNLEAIILGNRKGISGSSSRICRVEETQPETKDSNAEMSSYEEVLKDAKENKNAMSSRLNFDKDDNTVKPLSTSFKVSDGMAQGISGSSSRICRVEETQPETKDSNAEMSSYEEVLKDAKENKNAMSSRLNFDKDDNTVKPLSTSFKVSDGMAQGISGSSSRICRVEETQPETKDSNAEMSSYEEVLKDAKENKNAMNSRSNFDKDDNTAKPLSTSFKVSDRMAQEEDPKILLYKNLWVQTEATLCSLKHDVALLKLEMGSVKHLLKAKSQASSDALNCAASKSRPKDASVFARYRVLKGRDEPQELNSILDADGEKVGEKKEVPALVHRMGSGLFMNSAESAGVEESHASASDGSVIQSYNPKSHAKWLFSSGSGGGGGSLSAEWEHVLKDEFIW